MKRVILSIRDRLDRVGVLVSGLCMVHCLAGLVLVSVLGLGGEALLDPRIHRIGLALAVVIGAVTLGMGVIRHGQRGPLVIGALGIALMASAVVIEHGPKEAFLTIAGVLLVATAHIRNLRATA